MPGHMPHMSNRRSRHASQCRGLQSHFRLLAIPQMNAIVMDRMQGFFVEHILNHCVDGKIRRHIQTVTLARPEELTEERFRLEVFRELQQDIFEI